MPLEEYRRKRDFGKTPEPAPGRRRPPAPGPGGRRRFVIQRHRATRLHYDFRLEIDGVLVSWAVPKGPTLDNAIRRMAVHVEDHPMEYFDFEGVDPGQAVRRRRRHRLGLGDLGAGGRDPGPGQAIADGELKFRIQGEKVKGRFTIVRTSRRPGTAPRTAFEDDEGEQWLLLHKRDEFADGGLGRGGPPAEREVGPHQRRGQGERARDLGLRDAGRHRGDRPHAARRRRRCPATSSR